MLITRRKILQTAAGLASLGTGLYSYHRGIRLPSMHWDPHAIKPDFRVPGLLSATGEELIQVTTGRYHNASFRAFAPEPTLRLLSETSQRVQISVNNIAKDAELNYATTTAKISESQDGITRVLVIDLVAGRETKLHWRLPKLSRYTFASIGDTGGNHELAWCIQRAHQLSARFLLHLGDFNYQAGDYERSIELFNASEIPVYVAIGNHDFHDGHAIYPTFLNEIGPLNNAFSIGKTRFANIDTAANVLPFAAGERGKLFKALIEQNDYADTVGFTHRPLHDPSEDSTHDIGNRGERDWLIRKLKQAGIRSLLSGHIHIYHRSDFAGIDNIIAGQGLGHQDLLVNKDYSKMVIGQVDSDGLVSYRTEALAMPMELHCHPRSGPAKASSAHRDLIERVDAACLNKS